MMLIRVPGGWATENWFQLTGACSRGAGGAATGSVGSQEWFIGFLLIKK